MSDVPNFSYTIPKNRKYYRYRLPDGRYEPLGTDESVARSMAIELNIIRADREASKVTVAKVISEFRPVKLRSSKSEASRANWSMRLDRYVEWIGDKDISQITVRDLDDLLLEKAPQHEAYRCNRLLLGEVFVYAIGRGWREQSLGNPAKALLPPKLARQRSVKRRRRMTLEQFNKIREASPEWLRLAMDLSLTIGIRRGDVCSLKLSNFDGGYLRYIPAKTADIPTPAAISIKMDDTLTEIFNRAKALAPQSEYFLRKHNSFVRTGESAKRVDRTQVLPEQLSRKFRAVLRSLPELFEAYEDDELPTHHEIRSLCSRIKRSQGWETSRVQLLLGHSDEDMTAYYQSGADILWQEIELS